MLRTVKLDYQLCFGALEINDVVTNSALTIKVQRVLAEEVVPKTLFFFCHVLSQCFRIAEICFIILHVITRMRLELEVCCPSFDKEGCPKGGVVEIENITF